MGSETDPPRRPKVQAHPLARKPAPGARAARGARPARRPLPAGEQFFTPGATGVRRSVEQRSAAPLVFLFQLPRWLVPLAMVVLLLGGLVLPDWRGAVVVAPVLVFVVWLAYLSWPSLRPSGRLLRVALVTFLVLLTATRLGLI
ncbi:DUF6703 family protein [Microbispora sp. NPDC049125]|uniref:DUF6703 family protein n=1 Tax=Microbispora sp. NPDC049125 TaxID=3154929 RepID=UPI003466D4C2